MLGLLLLACTTQEDIERSYQAGKRDAENSALDQRAKEAAQDQDELNRDYGLDLIASLYVMRHDERIVKAIEALLHDEAPAIRDKAKLFLDAIKQDTKPTE